MHQAVPNPVQSMRVLKFPYKGYPLDTTFLIQFMINKNITVKTIN